MCIAVFGTSIPAMYLWTEVGLTCLKIFRFSRLIQEIVIKNGAVIQQLTWMLYPCKVDKKEDKYARTLVLGD
jgi:hypothetical protein